MTKVNDNSTVKIDDNLHTRISVIVKDDALKIKYSSKKQFVNIAVLELLEKVEKNRAKKVVRNEG